MDYLQFHHRLDYLMKERDITGRMLVKQTGKNPATISNYRTGVTIPSIQFLQQLKLFIPDMNVNWLLFNEGEPFLNNQNGSAANDQKKIVRNTALEEKISKMESIISGLNNDFKEVKQLAYESLEKLKGVASVRLMQFCNQFVNTQISYLYK